MQVKPIVPALHSDNVPVGFARAVLGSCIILGNARRHETSSNELQDTYVSTRGPAKTFAMPLNPRIRQRAANERGTSATPLHGYHSTIIANRTIIGRARAIIDRAAPPLPLFHLIFALIPALSDPVM